MHSREVNPSSSSKMESHSRHTPPNSSSAHATSGTGRIFHNSSSAAQRPSSAVTQVLPVHLVNTTGAVSAQVPSLFRCLYPVAVGSQPVVHRPWLAASAAGTQVSSLSNELPVSTYPYNFGL